MPVTHHPRPQLRRADWRNLDGPWRFAFDHEARWEHPSEVAFDLEINLPYPPESLNSGLNDTKPHHVVWYQRTVRLEPTERLPQGSRLLLHFGAVDYAATVWAGGQLVAHHEGGHTPFSADVTNAVQNGVLEIAVRAEDDPLDMAQPRGKQDWQPKPHVIWYPRTTGIWQTVWLEVVPQTRIARLEWSSNLERFEIALETKLAGPLRPNLSLRVRLSARGSLLRDDRIGVTDRAITHRIVLSNPGIDDERNHLLWSPEHPNLIDAEIELLEPGEAGQDAVLDQVSSYTALRAIGTDGRRFTLNGHGYGLRMALDQGYWPDSLMTATDDELRRDVELAKRLGFNGVRKHQKLESPRWLYWCDVLGLLVWEEMPAHYAFTPEAVTRLTREWTEAIERDRSHPCIVAWVPFNESWGVPDLERNPAHRHYVRALYHLTKTLDPTRPAITNDGWEFVGGDWIGIHDYTHKPEKLLERYGTPEATTNTLARPHGRRLLLEDIVAKLPIVLSEFGGIAFTPEAANGWGYSRAHDAEGFLERFEALLAATHQLRDIAGFCYTQLCDTFQEQNGLLTERREPKADPARLARAVRGERSAHEAEMEGEANPMGYSRRWYSPIIETQISTPTSSSND